MSFRHFSLRRSLASAPVLALVVPGVALAIGAFVWRRRFAPLPSMPRLPVRKPPRSSAPPTSLERASARAWHVDIPQSFWDAGELDDDEQDDPAEIPARGLPLVSEASQSAALLDPADGEASSVVLNW
jgi:hypothetical protein